MLVTVPGVIGQLFPSSRTTTWAPGVRGGVPQRSAVCATVAAGAGDRAAAIQAAIDACAAGQVVQLDAGTYSVSRTLVLSKGVVVRGAGPAQTRVVMPVGNRGPVFLLGRRAVKGEQVVALSGGGAKSSTTVTLASQPPSPYLVGELVMIDSLTDPNVTDWGSQCPLNNDCRLWFTRENRPVGQIAEIAGIAGANVQRLLFR